MKTRLQPGTQFLLVCLLLVYGMYVTRKLEPGYTFAKYDPGWMVFTVMSIAEDGDLDLRNQLQDDPKNAADQTSRGSEGQWYPLHEYLMAYLCVPFYLVMGILGCLVFNVLVVIVLMLLLYDLCRRHVDRKDAFIAVTLTAFTTLFFDYTYSFSLDVFGALLLVMSYRCVLTKNVTFSGFVWSLAVLGRTANVVTAPAFGAFVLLSGAADKAPCGKSFRSSFAQSCAALSRFVLGMLPVLILLSVTNFKMFGSPWTISYSRWQHFVEGKAILSSQGSAFTSSLLERLPAVLFDRKEGLFSGAPLLIIALVYGLGPFLRQSKKEAVLFTLICLSMIILYAKYTPWNLGGGNRYLMPIMALGGVPLSFAVRDAFKSQPSAL